MNAYYAGLPSDNTMKEQCHSSPNRWLAWQALALQTGLGLAIFSLCCLPAALTQGFAALAGGGAWGGNIDAFQEWLFSTVSFSFFSALIVVSLIVFVRYYLRSQYGPPTYYAELQTDLSQESVMEITRAFLVSNALEKTLLVDKSAGRLLGLMYESNLSSTFLEVTTMEMEPGRTWIGVRGASIVYGKARFLSAFYNDLGAARHIGSEMIDVFAPYASRKRRPFQNARASQQALPVIKLVDDCPPPLSTGPRVKHFGRAVAR
ncbi:MAG: hypothetical protein JST01_29590 [Cyanobacteria bacterium SZAS TMP-1]|nr:hypothetical protein [Cyanobacteria bacterium SZAS TMP-1]